MSEESGDEGGGIQSYYKASIGRPFSPLEVKRSPANQT